MNHSQGEYARGSVHSNTAEACNGLFKRSIQGAWHHISREHIERYLDEQRFRWSNRKATDADRTVLALGRVNGARLYHRTPEKRQSRACGWSVKGRSGRSGSRSESGESVR